MVWPRRDGAAANEPAMEMQRAWRLHIPGKNSLQVSKQTHISQFICFSEAFELFLFFYFTAVAFVASTSGRAPPNTAL